jgi:hypothetical protein
VASPAISRDFDPARISTAETIAAGAGIALFVFLFVNWFGPFSAWESFDVVDFLLAALGLFPVAVAGARAMGRDLLGDRTGPAIALAGVVATSMTLPYVLEGDNRKIGLWLSFLAAIALTYGGWRVMTDPAGTPGPFAGTGGGGAGAGVSPSKEGPGAPHPGTSTGAPGEEGGGPAPAAMSDPVPGQTAGQTPPGLAGEPPASGGTHPPGL